jgi:hypothetical protein
LLDFIVHPHFVILAGHDGDFAAFALAVDHGASSARHATKMAEPDSRVELIAIVI